VAKIKLSDESKDNQQPIIEVDDIIPKIKIYDPRGGYFYPMIGFNRKISDK
jgi:hypothetical protein